MKHLAILFALCACSAYSQTSYMNIHMKGGSTTSIPIQDIQKLTFDTLVISVGDGRITNVIKSFTLLQNYPNPFNPTTTIEFQIPKSGNGEIRIFNVAGHLVRTLKVSFQSPGTHSVVWDGRSSNGQPVATGAYLYQLAFDNSIVAKKMLLIK